MSDDEPSMRTSATEVLAAIGDPDADPNRPHMVLVSDPETNSRWHECYGPYDTAADAAAALDTIRSKIDIGSSGPVWTYTVYPLRPTP